MDLFLPMLVHVVWCAALYAFLTAVRAPVVWNVKASSKLISLCSDIEPRLSANLSNQFEWPVFFYVACLLVVSGWEVSHTFEIAAWIFVVGRLIHSVVQVFTSNVRLRGLIFSVNFIAVLAMWYLMLSALLV